MCFFIHNLCILFNIIITNNPLFSQLTYLILNLKPIILIIFLVIRIIFFSTFFSFLIVCICLNILYTFFHNVLYIIIIISYILCLIFDIKSYTNLNGTEETKLRFILKSIITNEFK